MILGIIDLSETEWVFENSKEKLMGTAIATVVE